jgi:hypothetical protein
MPYLDAICSTGELSLQAATNRHPLNELAMLHRLGSVDEFVKRFMALSYRDPSITEPQQIQLFIADLGDPL